MVPLRAVHMWWSAPGRLRGRRLSPLASLTPEALIVLVHSALAWRVLHGELDLFTDSAGARYLERLGLLDLYRRVNTRAFDRIDCDAFPPGAYPPICKFFALREAQLPVVLLDHDLIIHRPLKAPRRSDFVFAHWEAPNEPMYPALKGFRWPKELAHLGSFEWASRACNTAIALFQDERHREAYVRDGLTAFQVLRPLDKPKAARDWKGLFVEQRLVAFHARRLGLRPSPVAPVIWSPGPEDLRQWLAFNRKTRPFFHHTWGRKSYFARDPGERARYLAFRLHALYDSFPGAADFVGKVVQVSVVPPGRRRSTA